MLIILLLIQEKYVIPHQSLETCVEAYDALYDELLEEVDVLS